MINLNINEKKRLKFNIRVSGIQPQDLKGSMKIITDDVEYGFPISIDNGDVIVEVKPLSDVSNKQFEDGDVLQAKLEIIANETFIVPWSDTIKIEKPIKVEADIDNVEESVSEDIVPQIKISKIEEEIVKEVHKKVEQKKKEPKTKFGKLLEK